MLQVSQFDFVAPSALQISDEQLTGVSIPCKRHERISPELLGNTDIVYITRTQDERHNVPTGNGSAYALTPELVRAMRDTSIIMHPLPRLSELPTSVDSDIRAHYFEQAANGLPVRMALLSHVLGVST